MRRLVPVLLAAAALAAPVAASAQPAPPDPTAPALRGTPVLVREDAHHVKLYARFDRRIPQRFDGEPLATAAIDGRVASLSPVAGRRAACYAASAWIERADAGRLVGVSVSVEGAAPAKVSALVAIRSRPPLRC